jgi:hypothetical protein
MPLELAIPAVIALVAALIALRARQDWARDRELLEVVKRSVAAQLADKVGDQRLRARWLQVVRVDGDEALYGLGLDGCTRCVSARAVLTRRPDGAVSIRTVLLGQHDWA